MQTIALILETNNLHGGAPGSGDLATSLARLLEHLQRQSRPLASLDEVIITHEGLSEAEEARLSAAAGRAIRFVRLPYGTDYYAAKNAGFDASDASVVVFADADCWPDDAWLQEILAPLAEGSPDDVVAGRTCYAETGLGVATTTIDFMYFPSPLGEGCTRNFYANNVAFRRSRFHDMRFGGGEFYRGNCQVLGLRLQEAGVPVRFEPAARTTHRFPDSAAEFLRLRLLRGADAVELAPHLARAYLPKSLHALAGWKPLTTAAALTMRWMYSARSINLQDMPESKGLAYLACLARLSGVSLLDGVGAAAKLAGLEGLFAGKEGAAQAALSYHADRDRLSSAA